MERETHGSTPTSATRPSPILEAQAIDVGYGGISVVRGITISVGAGEVVALLGANGAGKTTTMMALAGVLRPSAGVLHWLGSPMPQSLHRRARLGLSFVPAEHPVIRGLTTRDNLRIGRGSLETALALFPELESLLDRKAGLLSGGEQQILTLARALASEPKVIIADELSLGLAPLVVGRLFDALRQAAERGAGVLLVEQQLGHALQMANWTYVMRQGRIALEGTGTEMQGRLGEIEAAYLSGGEGSLAVQGENRDQIGAQS